MGRFARIATAAAIGVWLAACSKPDISHTQSATPAEPGAARDLRLPGSAPQGAEVASALETGRPPINVATAVLHQNHAPLRNKTLAESPIEVPVVLPAASVEMGRLLDPVPMPESRTIFLAPMGEMVEATPVNVSAGTQQGGEPRIGQEYGGSRGPAIIIRGGMGGVDDKCDLRPRGFGGTAINRLTPPIGGRGASSRGGIR